MPRPAAIAGEAAGEATTRPLRTEYRRGRERITHSHADSERLS